jgi:hypothetical protein
LPEDNRPPLGPASILAPPAGWLGFLGIKSGGRQPLFTERDLRTILDMMPFYQGGQRTQLFNSGAIAAIQNGSSIGGTVPQGKVWVVDGLFAASSAAGATAAWGGSINVSKTGQGIYFAGPETSQRAVTGEIRTCSLKGPFVMMPGDQVSVFTFAAVVPMAFSWFITGFGIEVGA